MKRLNRTWLALFIVSIGYHLLPRRIRDEYDVTLRHKTFEVPHQFDTSRWDAHRTVASEGGTRFACLDCPATSRNRPPTGPCTGATT